jgi:hypothetical protein
MKEHWQVNTDRLAAGIREAATRARTEEDLKMAVEPILQRALGAIGVDVDVVRYEKATGLRSKMDAVYGYLIIEYKAPGRLSRSAGLSEAKEKLQQYLSEEAARFGPDLDAALEKGWGSL